MYTKHLAHKADNTSQQLLILLQGFCPSQLSNILLLILISSVSIPKKDLRLLLPFIGTAGMAPIHLLLPIPIATALVSFILLFVQYSVSINFLPDLLQNLIFPKWIRFRQTVHCLMVETATKQLPQCERCYNRDRYKPSGLPRWHSGKESTCQCRRCKFDPWVGKIPVVGNGHPLQYSCMENPMNRGIWQATVHGVAKSRTQLSDWAAEHTHFHKSSSNSRGSSCEAKQKW